MAVEILNTCNFFIMVNEFLKESGSTKEYKTGILYHAMQHVLTETPFNDDQLKEYFQLWQEFESLSKMFLKLFDTDKFLLDYEIDFILLGYSYSNQYDAKQSQLMDDINENYGNLNCEVRFKKMEIDAFIKQAKEILKPMNKQQRKLSA